MPVKIDPDSEAIEAGDFLTSSDKPGLAMKATKAGYTVGKALESWSPGGPDRIDIFVNLGYNFPESQLSESSQTNESLTVESDLNVLANTTLNNVVITGDLAIGQFNIDSIENSLNITGPACFIQETGVTNTELCEAQTLKIMSNLAGNIDIFDGGITLLPDGTIKANKVVAGSYSVKSDSQSAGEAVLGANSNHITIENPNIKADSKVFVTPTSSTNGQSLIVSEKIEGTSFTVSIDNTFDQDVNFDWWILNVE